MADYTDIIAHYENCFRTHGDNHKGADWPNAKDMRTRYEVMLGVIDAKDNVPSVLDFGCGTGMLRAYLEESGRAKAVAYSGLDVSSLLVDAAKKKFPETEFLVLDALKEPSKLGSYDYILMNGVFTEKRELSYEQMLHYFKSVLRVVFPRAQKGIAFNVMSKSVDWERNDLFHLPTETFIEFAIKELSRHFVVRNDYGLYEYTVYLYREPQTCHG